MTIFFKHNNYFKILGILFCVFQSCTYNDNLQNDKITSANGSDSNKQIVIDNNNLKITVKIALGEDNGSNLGTLFELYDNQNKLIGYAGFNNGVNTRLTTNKKTLSFYFNPDNRIFQPELTAIGNPFPDNNEWNRIFTYKDKLYAFANINGKTQLKNFDETTKKWIISDLKIPATANSKLVNIETFENNIIWVFEKQICIDNIVVYEEKSLKHIINGFGFSNNQFFIYSLSSDEGIKNQIRYGSLIQQDNNPVFQIDTLFYGLCNNPVSCSIYGWSYLKDAFYISTNYGHIYKLDNKKLSFFYKKLSNSESWQAYGFIQLGDSIMVGHYPSGNLFVITHDTIHELENKNPVPESASPEFREAQTMAIYSGGLVNGLWPWGELWQYRFYTQEWIFLNRAFTYPEIRHEDAPFVERFLFNDGNYNNHWGQRIIDLIPYKNSLIVNTGAKNIIKNEYKKYLFPKEIEQYGMVYKMYIPCQVAANITWKEETELVFQYIDNNKLQIIQDGELIASDSIYTASNLNIYLSKEKGLFGKCNKPITVIN